MTAAHYSAHDARVPAVTCKTRALIRRLLAAVVLASCVSALTLASASAAVVVTPLPTETLQEYEGQLSGGQVKSVIINLPVRSLHVTLASGKTVLVHYPPHQEATVVNALKAKGIVPVTPKGKAVLPPKPHKHKLRYIVGGVVILVILIVGGVLLLQRRRRAAADY